MTESTAAPASTPESGAQQRTLHAVVLSGGLNFEREVSLSSGTQVVEGLVRA